MRRLPVWLLMTLLVCSRSMGAISFSVTTERTHVVMGEQIVVTATIVSNAEIKNIAAPALPPSEYYKLLRVNSNQSQSSSIQIINGKMTQTREITYIFSYALSMLKEGTFTFPALEFKYSGTAYASEPFTISVGKEPVASKDLSISLRLSKKQLYVGEQCICTIEIAKRPQAPLNFTNQGFVTIIESLEKTFGKNFSITRLFSDKVAQSQTRINGEIYQTFSLSFSVTPIAAGNFNIPGVPFEYVELRQVQQRGNDIFDDFFGGSFFGRSVQQVPKTAVSNSISLAVKPLPPAPAGFTGAVGSFTLESAVNETSVPAGEAITLNIMVKGSTRPGNVGDIQLPQIPGFEIFTPEKHTFIDTSAQGIATRKKFKYLCIPQEEGEKTIPPITYTYFNPAKGSYATLSTDPIPLIITKGKNGTKQQSRYLTQEDIRQVGSDIRYIKTSPGINHQLTEPHKNPLFFVLFPVPFCIALFAFLYRIQATLFRKDPAVTLRKEARRRALLTCAKLEKECVSAVPANALTRVTEIIETYITHRFGFAAIGKTLDELKGELSRRVIDQSITDALIPFLELCDRYRFGGTTPDQKTVTALCGQARQIVENLEQRAKKA